MDDFGLQHAIFESFHQNFQRMAAAHMQMHRQMHAAPSRPAPQNRNIAPQPRTIAPQSNTRAVGGGVPIGHRNQLAREGILPRPTFSTGRSASSSLVPHPRPSGVVELDDEESRMAETGRPSTRAPTHKHFYDKLLAWKELSVGGRSQAQNQQQDHILLITEEGLPDKINTFHGSEALLLMREEPIDLSDSRSQSLKFILKSLTGSGKYSTFAVGFTTASPEGLKGFMGLSVHFEYTGAVFISVDEWAVTRDTGMPGVIMKKMERKITLEKAQQVKPKRDGLEIRIPFTNRSIDVIINDHLHFKNVMACELGGDSDEVRVCFLAAGGRFSAKHIEFSDGSTGSGGGNSGLPPPPPTRHPKAVASAPVAGRRSNSRPPNTPGRLGSNSRQSASPAGGNARASSQQQQQGSTSDDPFVQMIEAEIIDRSPNVNWEDVAGVADAKAILNEAVVLPLIVPELFTGVRTPWKGVLLYGPPGTGKTMLAKAVATSAKTTFYSISASTLLSRFHGESEKMVKALFQSARANAPSTIFFDEIDALMSKRGGQNEHEVSRRVKAEMLQQIDGVSTNAADGRVMLLAATNTPWDLDEAMRRRLEKRIYISLPDEKGRLEFLQRQANAIQIDKSVTFEDIARLTEGYSGADMSQLCRDAAMMPMRRLIADKSPQQIAEMKALGQMSVPPVTKQDFLAALSKVKPSVSQNELGKYVDWTKEFSSV